MARNNLDEVLQWITIAGQFFGIYDHMVGDLYMLCRINVIVLVSVQEKMDLVMRSWNWY